MSVKAAFINGKLRGVKTELEYAPPYVEVLGERYERIDDPDTGEYLGAYARVSEPAPLALDKPEYDYMYDGPGSWKSFWAWIRSRVDSQPEK